MRKYVLFTAWVLTRVLYVVLFQLLYYPMLELGKFHVWLKEEYVRSVVSQRG